MWGTRPSSPGHCRDRVQLWQSQASPARLAPVRCFIRQTREKRARIPRGREPVRCPREASRRGPTAGYGEGWAPRSSLPPTRSVCLGAASEQVAAVSRRLSGVCADPGERGRAGQATLSFSGLQRLAFAPLRPGELHATASCFLGGRARALAPGPCGQGSRITAPSSGATVSGGWRPRARRRCPVSGAHAAAGRVSGLPA